jgi:hypothetical protein
MCAELNCPRTGFSASVVLIAVLMMEMLMDKDVSVKLVHLAKFAYGYYLLGSSLSL